MMIISPVQMLIEQELASLRADPSHAVLPLRRLEIYDALGPTYASSSYVERIEGLKAGNLRWTRGDRVRARLAMLTAQHVAPLWEPTFEEAGLLGLERISEDVQYAIDELVRLHVAPEGQPSIQALLSQKPLDFHRLQAEVASLDTRYMEDVQRAVIEECIAVGLKGVTERSVAAMNSALDHLLARHRSMYHVPLLVWPAHIHQITEGVLQQTIEPGLAVMQAGDLQEILGNVSFFTEDIPARATDICQAAREALNQSLGLGPFDGEEITATTTDKMLEGQGAAATSAVTAYSGVYEDNMSTDEYDIVRQREFWMWWLTEAIPQALLDEADDDESIIETMPFRDTVRVTRFRTGIQFDFLR